MGIGPNLLEEFARASTVKGKDKANCMRLKKTSEFDTFTETMNKGPCRTEQMPMQFPCILPAEAITQGFSLPNQFILRTDEN